MDGFKLVKILALLVCVLTVFCLTSCTTDYVTGKKTFSLVGESQELALGKEADPQIVAEYGEYEDPELSAYVNELGQALAAESHRPQLTYTFRVLDSPIVNAFALPGGYIYVTRGILVHFNSEDELAGVVGHELGHVAGRHGAEQMSRQQLAGLGLGLGVAFWEDFRKFADIAGAGVQLLFLKYSRSQESEADRLGVEYSTKLGYDAHKMADFFGTLERMSEKSGQSLPGFMSTHPDPGDRNVRVSQLAGEWQQRIQYRPLHKKRYEYLKFISGMVYGEDPQQGYVEGSMFYHPAMRFQFPIPADWRLVNSPSTVLLVSPDKKAIVQLRLGKGESTDKVADDFIAKNGVAVRSRRRTTVHGFSATVLQSGLKNEEQDILIYSTFIEKDGSVYAFHGYTATAVFNDYVGSFRTVMDGFEEVRDRAVLDKKPRRVIIKEVPESGELASAFRSLGVSQEMYEELAVLNGMELGDRVEKGYWVKLVGE